MPAQKLDLPVSEIIQKYKRGMSVADIADDYGVSNTPIRKRLKENNISFRGDAVSQNDTTYEEYYDEWERLYVKKGWHTTEVGEEFGVPANTVARSLKRRGVELRSVSEAKRNDDVYDEDRLRQLYVKEDLSIPKVADRMSVTYAVVYRALKHFGFEITRKFQTGPNHHWWREENRRDKYYSSKEWRELRERRIEKDKYECVACGHSRQNHKEEFGCDLHVHHITPVEQFDNREDADYIENLITLCASCHRDWEGIPLRPQHE